MLVFGEDQLWLSDVERNWIPRCKNQGGEKYIFLNLRERERETGKKIDFLSALILDLLDLCHDRSLHG